MADSNEINEFDGSILDGKTNLKTVSLSKNDLTHVNNLFDNVSIKLKAIMNFEISILNFNIL